VGGQESPLETTEVMELKKRSKRYREALQLFDRQRLYHPREAISIIKKMPSTRFDETVEVAFRLGVDPRKADQMVRGTVSLPHGTGKDVRVVVIAEGDKAREAEEAGADYVGGPELLEKIKKEDWFDFDAMVATPDMMSHVGKMGKILGPKGLMPSPKAGTVTNDLDTAIKEYAAGKVEYRNDTGGNIHSVVGKFSFDNQKLVDNINAMINNIRRIKPATSKGQYIKKVVIKGTMTPAVELDVH